MKNNLYRFSYIFLNILLIILDVFFITKIAYDLESNIIHLITFIVLICFQIFQIYSIFKGFFKKNEDFIISDLVYEKDGKLNKFPLIVSNCLLGLSFILIIVFTILSFIFLENTLKFYVLIAVFALVFIDMLYYDLYILLRTLKKKDIYKVIK